MSNPSEAALAAVRDFSLNKMGGRTYFRRYDEIELARLLDSFAHREVGEWLDRVASTIENPGTGGDIRIMRAVENWQARRELYLSTLTEEYRKTLITLLEDPAPQRPDPKESPWRD